MSHPLELLARPRVILACYCPTPAHVFAMSPRQQMFALECHRVVLAEILVCAGATYAGELDPNEGQMTIEGVGA